VTARTTVHLVRHAKAGSRRAWSADDALRPLSKRGRAQARALAKRLSGARVSRIVTSPFVRCVETVSPLAERTGLELETSDALGEGASLADSLQVFGTCVGHNAVLCTHGDVLGDLLSHFARQGVAVDDDRMEKGSVWELELVDGEVRRARYVAPPGP
jgi:8-oxo-dGTP diphosphatase